MKRSVDEYPTFEGLCCICWCSAETTTAEFEAQLQPALSQLSKLGAQELILNLADGPPPPIERKREDGSRIIATVSLRMPESAAGDALSSLRSALEPLCSFLAVYRQEVALPRAYERDWPDGARSPGIKQISLIRRKPGMQPSEFLEHWHHTHTPLALQVHPLWSYVRGVVLEGLTPGAPDYEGIVELHFKELEDVTDMQRFYGGDIANMSRIAQDVQSFIDLSSIEIVHASERVLTSSFGQPEGST